MGWNATWKLRPSVHYEHETFVKVRRNLWRILFWCSASQTFWFFTYVNNVTYRMYQQLGQLFVNGNSRWLQQINLPPLMRPKCLLRLLYHLQVIPYALHFYTFLIRFYVYALWMDTPAASGFTEWDVWAAQLVLLCWKLSHVAFCNLGQR